VVLTYTAFGIWISIITESKIHVSEDGSTNADMFNIAFDQSDRIYSYIAVCSLITIFMFIKLMNFFTFSSKLSMFYEVIQRASYDIFFFTIIFWSIITVFSLVGHILFGVTDDKFEHFSESILTMLLMVVGGVTSIDIETDFSIAKHIFGILYVLITLLLLNMFIAIIGSHYFEFYLAQGGIKLSAVTLIIKAVFGESVDEGQNPNASKISRIKFRILSALKNLFRGLDSENNTFVAKKEVCRYLSFNYS